MTMNIDKMSKEQSDILVLKNQRDGKCASCGHEHSTIILFCIKCQLELLYNSQNYSNQLVKMVGESEELKNKYQGLYEDLVEYKRGKSEH